MNRRIHFPRILSTSMALAVLVATAGIGSSANAQATSQKPTRPSTPTTQVYPQPTPTPTQKPSPGQHPLPDSTVPREPTPQLGNRPSLTNPQGNGSSGNAPADQANVPQPPAACNIPTWLADESAHVDDAVLRLHKLQDFDTSGYKKDAPANCALELFKYRVFILNKVITVMEGK